MSHLHIPDGVLPVPLWAAGLLILVATLWLSVRFGSPASPQRIAYQAGLGGLMLAVMAIPVPIFGFDYCMTLAGPVGVLLGAAGALQVSFAVTLILALMGQGGFTVVGLNTFVLGLGAAIARPLYVALAPRWGPAGAMALATAGSQTLSSLAWIVILVLSVQWHPSSGHEPSVAESLSLLQRGALAAVVLPLIALAVTLESLLGAGIGRFLGRVRPDLLPHPAAVPTAVETRP